MAAWAKRQLGAGVMSVGELGRSGTAFRLELVDNRSVVLRQWTGHAPDGPATVRVLGEGAAFGALAGSGLPVPELLATDPTGDESGWPSLVMSWLPGQAQPNLDVTQAAAVGELLAMLHRTLAVPGLVHGAFDPGVLLWAGGTPTGVVGWDSSGPGSPEVDLRSCAAALREVSGPGVAAAFESAYSAA